MGKASTPPTPAPPDLYIEHHNLKDDPQISINTQHNQMPTIKLSPSTIYSTIFGTTADLPPPAQLQPNRQQQSAALPSNFAHSSSALRLSNTGHWPTIPHQHTQ